MPLRFYMDHHIPRAITFGLPRCGVDVLTTQEDDAERLADPELLDRATQLGRVLFTFDDDLLAEASRRQQINEHFSGLVYAHFQEISIGKIIHDLEIVAKAGQKEDLENFVLYLPL
ncbi:MAG: DUF5615 family PIN-like protein [bacterium]